MKSHFPSSKQLVEREREEGREEIISSMFLPPFLHFLLFEQTPPLPPSLAPFPTMKSNPPRPLFQQRPSASARRPISLSRVVSRQSNLSHAAGEGERRNPFMHINNLLSMSSNGRDGFLGGTPSGKIALQLVDSWEFVSWE